MRSISQISLLVAAMVMLSACNKEAEPTEEKAATKKEQSAQSPFLRNGELLSVNVDAMPRQVFIAKMAELTGVKITAEGDNNQPVTVHAVDASLRKILSMAIADAPYSVTMQYTNLQDSFPASVTVGRYQAGAPQQPAASAAHPSPFGAGRQMAATMPSAVVPQTVQEEPAGPDFSAMDPNEQITYFLGQPKDDQVSIIFDMEPTAQESELMATLMAKEAVSGEVKMEMLDSLSNGEYEKSAPAIKIALDSSDSEVATKAVEVLAEMGSAKDIPALKALAEKSDNEDVRTAVSDAIETLQQ